MRNSVQFFITVATALILTSCFMYEEMVYDNPYDPTGQDGINLEYNDIYNISIDGDTSDWNAVPVLLTDNVYELTEGLGLSLPQGSDIFQVKAVQDDDSLYFFVETTDGTPFVTQGTEMSFDMNSEDVSINLAGIRHDTSDGITSEGTFSYWSNYNYYDNTISDWNGYAHQNPGIRFAGINNSDVSMEFAVSKATYWDELYTQTGFNFQVSTWYQYYADNFDGNGTCDYSNDNQEISILLRSANENTPRSDSPIVQFPRGTTPSIDGALTDMTIWEEYGIWFQDFQNDAVYDIENNEDIDKVYMKQDENYLYILLTFFDGGVFGPDNAFNIYIENDSGDYAHFFSADQSASVWTYNADVYYASYTPDGSGHSAAGGTGFIEMRFNKFLAWPDLPYEPLNFTIEVYNSSALLTDMVRFKGMYKSLDDTIAPTDF